MRAMLMSISRTAAALVCGALLPCASYALDVPAGATGLRSFPVTGHGTLALQLPSDWKQELRQAPGVPPTIVFSPATGDEFRTMITVLWNPDGGAPVIGPNGMQQLIDMDVNGMLPTSVEKQVTIKKIDGKDAAGYYFLVTDKAPKPGEYPYAVRSGVVVGNLLLSTTVLCRSKDTIGIAATIEALRTARQLGR